MSTTQSPDDLVARWAGAEATGDSATLDAVLADDFRGVGPHGFVLDRAQWLDRFAQGFAVEELVIDDVEVREHGDVAAVIGVQAQRATYRGHPSHGRFRISFVLRRRECGWSVLGVALSGPIPDGTP